MIKHQFNEHPFTPITEYPYVILHEQVGTVEIAKALRDRGINIPVFLNRDYDPEEIVEHLTTVKAGMRLNATEYDLKRFTKVHTSLPKDSIQGVYICDEEFPDNIDFINFLKKFAKFYPNVKVTAGEFKTREGAIRALEYVDDVVISGLKTELCLELSPIAHQSKKSLIFPWIETESLLHSSYGCNAYDISVKFQGCAESAGAVVTSYDNLVKKFRDTTYYNNNSALEIFDDVHNHLEQTVYYAGFNNLKDFIKFARIEK